MHRLLLLRHAKSAWDDPGLRDFDRPLNARGRKAAPAIGAYLAREGLVPDRVIVSAAARTRETWNLVSASWPSPRPPAMIDERIYEASPNTIRAVIGERGGDARSLLVIGHNPGFEMLSLALAARERTKARAALERKFPTAALCVLDLDIDDWTLLADGSATIERFVTPQSIGAMDADD